MPALAVITATNPRLLLEAAANAFLSTAHRTPHSAHPFPSPPYLLALRQGQIREDLYRLAADRGVPGWFDPPLCTFRELPAILGQPETKPLPGMDRLVLVSEILRGWDGAVLTGGTVATRFADHLDRLFGELVSEGVTPDDLATAGSSMEHHGAFEHRRDTDVVGIYRQYLERVGEAGRRDGRDSWLAAAREVARDPEALSHRLGGRREIRLFGLNDMRLGWRHLLAALVSSPALDRVAIYTGPEVRLDLDLPHETVALEENHSVATALFGDDPAPDAGSTVQVLEIPDGRREIEEVALRVRALVDAGADPEDIAVVTRQARPYTGAVLDALETLGVPAVARERVPLLETPVVRALITLLTGAADGWTRHALVEIAQQPYFRTGMRPRVLNHIGFQRAVTGLHQWRTHLQLLLDDSRSHYAVEEGEEPKEQDRGRPLPRPERVEAALDGFERLEAVARDLEAPRPLDEWLEWLAKFLERDPLAIETTIWRVPQQRFTLARTDFIAWRGLAGMVNSWREAVDRWGGPHDPIDVAGFLELLRENLAADVPMWTTAQRGVQVLEGLAAAYRSFAHVFLVGVSAGRFPVHAPRSPVYQERERESLIEAGLPLDGPETREHREQELFRSLVSSARVTLTVSYPLLDPSGGETLPSPFVEDLMSACRIGEPTRVENVSFPLAATPKQLALAHRSAAIEVERERGEPSVHAGSIEDADLVAGLAGQFDDDHLWSPTKLESYAKCPWAFFASRILRLDQEDDPDQEMDATTRGTILHEALRLFFDRAIKERGAPLYLREHDLVWAEPALVKALDSTIEAVRTDEYLGHPTLLPAKREELRRILLTYIRAEAGEHELSHTSNRGNAPRLVRSGVVEHEREIGEAVLDRNGVRFKYRGRIDRVEGSVDERFDGEYMAAVDYKTSSSSAPGGTSSSAWREGVVLQVPLYAHALEQQTGKEVSRVEYWGLKQGKPVHRLRLKDYTKKHGLRDHGPDNAKMEDALDRVAHHVTNVRRGNFPADPPESCGCPFYCPALDVCRVAGGVRDKWAWNR